MRCFPGRSLLPTALWVLFSVGLTAHKLQADIVATGFFSGTIERFNATTGTQTTFATIASVNDPFPGLAGIVYDASNNWLYASARISNRIYRIDSISGSVLGFQQLALGSSPAGLAVDASGNLYVSNNGGNTISIFDIGGNSLDTIALPDIGLGNNLPSGLAFDSQGRLVVSTFAGGSLFRYDPGSDTSAHLGGSPLANGQVAIDAAGNNFVGGAAFANDVLKFTPDGIPIGSPFLTIDEVLLPQPPLSYASPDFTSPSGVTIDADGNLIVAALGRTNPTSEADNFQSNGGLWKIAPDGTLLQTFGTGITPLSSVTMITAIPEPSSAAVFMMATTAVVFRRRRRS